MGILLDTHVRGRKTSLAKFIPNINVDSLAGRSTVGAEGVCSGREYFFYIEFNLDSCVFGCQRAYPLMGHNRCA